MRAARGVQVRMRCALCAGVVVVAGGGADAITEVRSAGFGWVAF